MKRVIVFGVFDLFHFGHLRMLQRARRLGDYLIVAVQRDEFVARYKPAGAMPSLYTLEERQEMLRSLKIVDEVISYETVDADIKKTDFDIFVRGTDNNHAGFLSAVKYCEDTGREAVVLPRTEGISSTYIKRLLNDFSAKGDENLGQE